MFDVDASAEAGRNFRVYANKDVSTNINAGLSANLSVTTLVCIAVTSPINMYQYVPHKAVAEVSKIGKL